MGLESGPAMTWEAMTMDEFAAFQSAFHAKVVQIDGIWWKEVHPFFFRPLFPFTEVRPDRNRYPRPSLLGGILHPVPPGAISNSCVNMFVYDDIKDYGIEGVGAKQRSIIKKALSNFSARRITDLREFVDGASPLYVSFFYRTQYYYQRERLKKETFEAWARPLFDYPKVVVTGAFRGDRLCAIDVSYQVEDVIIDDVFFSDTESQALKVTDFMVHTLRESAKSSRAGTIFRGYPSGKMTLDRSKLTRGCKVLKVPALLKINPLALYMSKTFMANSYQKLLAITDPNALTDASYPAHE